MGLSRIRASVAVAIAVILIACGNGAVTSPEGKGLGRPNSAMARGQSAEKSGSDNGKAGGTIGLQLASAHGLADVRPPAVPPAQDALAASRLTLSARLAGSRIGITAPLRVETG